MRVFFVCINFKIICIPQQVPDDLKLGLLLEVKTTAQEHETLMTVIMDAAIKSVDSFLKMVQSTHNLC